MKSKTIYIIQIVAGFVLALYFNPFSFNLQVGILGAVICILLVYISLYGLQKGLSVRQLPGWMRFAMIGAWVTVAAFVALAAFLTIAFSNFGD